MVDHKSFSAERKSSYLFILCNVAKQLSKPIQLIQSKLFVYILHLSEMVWC